jgi:magnesium transporter
MLRIHRLENSHLVAGSGSGEPNAFASPPVWLDLYNPTPEDYRYVEQLPSLHLPTREEMQE